MVTNLEMRGNIEDLPDILTVDDLQKILGISRSMAYRLIRSEEIKHLRIGRIIRIPKRYLVDFIYKAPYNEGVVVSNPSVISKEVV